jgi:hypothetical protein
MTDRIPALGAMVFHVPEPKDFPELVARIGRLWAELHEADPALALELARKLPTMQIRRG